MLDTVVQKLFIFFRKYRYVITLILMIAIVWMILSVYTETTPYQQTPKMLHEEVKGGYYRQIEENRGLLEDQYLKMTPIDVIRSSLTLKNLYYNGIPDKYDLKGNKIRGIPPNPELAIYYLNTAIKNGYIRGWIELGEMYHYGFYDFPSNLNEAENIYMYIINNINDTEVVNRAYQLYQEAHHENEQIMTHQWLNLPYTTVIQPKKTQYELGQQKSRPHPSSLWTQFDAEPENPIDINQLYRAGMGHEVDMTSIEKEPKIKNDLHNVHDHSVIATLRQSVEKLQKETSMTKNSSQCLSEIRYYLSSLPDNDKKQDALLTLSTIENSHLPLSFTNLKEIDALTLVWNRIHDPSLQENCRVLKENLADELAECIEHDKPVCQTGRFSRVMDTLNGVDTNVKIVPTFAINEEMMTKAGKIRDDTYEQLDEESKKQVDSMAPNPFQKEWTQKLRQNIKDQLYQDYVKSDIMLESTFNTEIQKWIDEI